jgi:FkbM family methyltransferase
MANFVFRVVATVEFMLGVVQALNNQVTNENFRASLFQKAKAKAVAKVSFLGKIDAAAGYSDEGQDVWVLSVLGDASQTQPRKFLEIGARDGDFFSNSRRLEDHGWRGICVEPFPTNFDKFQRKCTLVQKALVAEIDPQRVYSNCEDGSGVTGHSGFSKENKNPATSTCTQTVLPQTTYAELSLPKHLDYVSIDVEGLELELLKAFPFGDTCATLWTIEGGHLNEEIRNIMTQNGCNLAKETKSDGFFQCACP